MSWERLGPLQDRKHTTTLKIGPKKVKNTKNTIFGIFGVCLPYLAGGGSFLFCRGPSFSQGLGQAKPKDDGNIAGLPSCLESELVFTSRAHAKGAVLAEKVCFLESSEEPLSENLLREPF